MKQKRLVKAMRLRAAIKDIESSIERLKQNDKYVQNTEIGLTIDGPIGKSVIPESIHKKAVETIKSLLDNELKKLEDEFERL
jgi:hypothetical protein